MRVVFQKKKKSKKKKKKKIEDNGVICNCARMLLVSRFESHS